ncbi:MAG: leucine-rich repeat domain-containing protein [Bacteroidota bacterium]
MISYKSTIYMLLLMGMFSSCRTAPDLSADANAPVAEKLKITSNHLKELSPSIKRYKRLKVLNLYNNDLTTLPPEIGELTELEELAVSSNSLKSIPPEIGKLKKLKRLSLKFNNLTSLPEEIGELQRLEVLEVQYNHLNSLPSSITHLKNLTHLYLNNNDLTSIPENIDELVKLQFLYIGKNSLSGRLPSQLGNITGLRELDIAGSGVMIEVPSEIVNARTLEVLYIDQTTIIPYNLKRLGTKFRVVMK